VCSHIFFAGKKAEKNDFLARNGLRFGKMYGMAIDMSANGPSEGLWRDEYHKSAVNGDQIEGHFLPIAWQWDGEVKDFIHDGAWEFQDAPPGYESTDIKFWNANGNDNSGSKTEHCSPDPRAGKFGFIQGSTAGYFDHIYLKDLDEILSSLPAGPSLPDAIDFDMYVYQGETSVVDQIKLGDKGKYVKGTDATKNYDAGDPTKGKETFEDIDGLEVIMSKDGLYAIIQEDSGNDFGERMFITKLEHNADKKDLTYYFMAMSGGNLNTRMLEGVGIPAGTSGEANGHEFSGVSDLSPLLAKEDGCWVLDADDAGYHKNAAAAEIDINDKYILLGLQAHNLFKGIIEVFQGDRGGQWLLFQPKLP
jgi:hypothetical protein